jgi:hypothetical protein
VELERDVFRSGAAQKPNVEYLRFIDLDIEDPEGRIPDDQTDQFMVAPGRGISLLLERMIPEGLVVMDAAAWRDLGKSAKKKIHWWGIDQGQPIPSGLSLVYDGHPPGHCTLTVTRQMTVKSFLALVALITFTLRATDLVGPIH